MTADELRAVVAEELQRRLEPFVNQRLTPTTCAEIETQVAAMLERCRAQRRPPEPLTSLLFLPWASSAAYARSCGLAVAADVPDCAEWDPGRLDIKADPVDKEGRINVSIALPDARWTWFEMGILMERWGWVQGGITVERKEPAP